MNKILECCLNWRIGPVLVPGIRVPTWYYQVPGYHVSAYLYYYLAPRARVHTGTYVQTHDARYGNLEIRTSWYQNLPVLGLRAYRMVSTWYPGTPGTGSC